MRVFTRNGPPKTEDASWFNHNVIPAGVSLEDILFLVKHTGILYYDSTLGALYLGGRSPSNLTEVVDVSSHQQSELGKKILIAGKILAIKREIESPF